MDCVTCQHEVLDQMDVENTHAPTEPTQDLAGTYDQVVQSACVIYDSESSVFYLWRVRRGREFLICILVERRTFVFLTGKPLVDQSRVSGDSLTKLLNRHDI